MTLTLNLPPELEQYLLQEASQHGLSVEAFALQLLTNSLELKQKQAEAVNLLQAWMDGSGFSNGWQRMRQRLAADGSGWQRIEQRMRQRMATDGEADGATDGAADGAAD